MNKSNSFVNNITTLINNLNNPTFVTLIALCNFYGIRDTEVIVRGLAVVVYG